jgi:enamine deaminase RidA (YjgF/YER057c/UK114 family)
MTDEQRQSVSTDSPYEPVVGISRAVRIGQFIAVSGTAPLASDGRTVAIGDPEGQARRCLEIAQEALERLGASLKDVIRTRILHTRIDDWEKVARVHGEFFSQIRPVSTVVQVSRFVDSDWLVEIEVDAVVCD